MSEVRTTAGTTYRLLRLSTDLAYRLWFRRVVEGAEHVPREGPVVLASNHQSFLDIPLIAQALPGRHVSFLARDTLANSKLLAWIMDACGAVLVKRGASDRAALREMLAHLDGGDALAVFPEGTRTRDGSVGEFRRGALHVARKSGAPVVPVAIRGAFEALGRQHAFPRPRKVAIRFGPPIDAQAEGAAEEVERAVLDMVGDGRYHSGSVAGR